MAAALFPVHPGMIRQCFDSFFGKKGQTPLTLDVYKERYVREMEAQAGKIGELAARVDRGENVTLLCSRDCILPPICHRTSLAQLVEAARRP